MRSFFLTIFSVLLLSSCDNNYVYGEDKDIPIDGWQKDSTLIFETDSLTELPSIIKIGVNIRNTTDYLYRNLYLFLEIEIPGRTIPIRDTINHDFMTPDGYWKDGVEGATIKESTLYYPYAIQNPEKGIYKIKVQQAMRDELLRDIISIGVRIEKLDRE